jgi:hypothetical protein
MKSKFYLIILFIFAVSCGEKKSTEPQNTSGTFEAIAQEVLHVSEYSYVRVYEGSNEKWLAAPITNITIGSTYYYDNPMQMQGFESKALGRTFETIYFVENLRTTKEPLANTTPQIQKTEDNTNIATKPVIEKAEVTLEKANNSISIAELFKDMEKYNNQVVRIKGKVTKYNPAIMNVNWLHLQDGTEYNGEFDLTVTTSSQVQVNAIVVVEGKVSLNKDFGAGYKYKIIVENAKVTNE